MSKDYSTSIVIGWVLGVHSFLKPLRKKVKEESHTEDRFDPKSGARIGRVKVIDKEGGYFYVYGGEEYDRAPDPSNENEEPIGMEILESIGTDVGASITLHGDFESGEGMVVAITTQMDGSFDDEITFAQIDRVKKKLGAIHNALIKLKLLTRKDTPKVHAVIDAG